MKKKISKDKEIRMLVEHVLVKATNKQFQLFGRSFTTKRTLDKQIAFVESFIKKHKL